jgi:hypothetical protein
MNETKGVILVLAYTRAELLNELFENIQKLIGVKNLSIVVVLQIGNESVRRTIKNWRDKVEVLIETDGSALSTAENISKNRLAGYAVCFDSLGADWVLAVEDDVLLAQDTILFTSYIFRKYASRRNFRAINLGSRLKKSDVGQTSYTLTRFGLYGQASVLTKTTWKRMNRVGIIKSARSGHWDSAIEAFVKTGFCVAPNNSRYIDRGWVEATHMSSNPEEEYYKDLKASYVDDCDPQNVDYKKIDLNYWWRKDLRRYQSFSNSVFWILFFTRHPVVIRIFQKFRKIYKDIFTL